MNQIHASSPIGDGQNLVRKTMMRLCYYVLILSLALLPSYKSAYALESRIDHEIPVSDEDLNFLIGYDFYNRASRIETYYFDDMEAPIILLLYDSNDIEDAYDIVISVSSYVYDSFERGNWREEEIFESMGFSKEDVVACGIYWRELHVYFPNEDGTLRGQARPFDVMWFKLHSNNNDNDILLINTIISFPEYDDDFSGEYFIMKDNPTPPINQQDNTVQ